MKFRARQDRVTYVDGDGLVLPVRKNLSVIPIDLTDGQSPEPAIVQISLPDEKFKHANIDETIGDSEIRKRKSPVDRKKTVADKKRRRSSNSKKVETENGEVENDTFSQSYNVLMDRLIKQLGIKLYYLMK